MIKIYKCDVTYSLHPLCHKLSHLFGPPPPSSVTYFMNGPKELFHQSSFYIVNNELIHQSSLYLKNIPASISTTLFAFFRAGRSGGNVRGENVLDPCSWVCAPTNKRER